MAPDAAGGDAEPDAPWMPGGDPEWTVIDWAGTCTPPLEYAKRPENVSPPLEWKDCGPGCQVTVPNWGVDPNRDTKGADLRQGDHRRLNANFVLEGASVSNYQGGRFHVYDENDRLIAAWRIGPEVYDCGIAWVGTTWDHECIIVPRLDQKPLYALAPFGDPSATPIRVVEGVGDVPSGCSESLYAAQWAGGDSIWDLSGDTVVTLPISGEVHLPRLYGDVLLVPVMTAGPGREKSAGWRWTPSDGASLLVDRDPRMIYDICTDGESVVWFEADATTILALAGGEIWASPHAETPAQLVPRKLADVTQTVAWAGAYAIGGGYYAYLEERGMGQMRDYEAQLIRIADGAHWKVELPEPYVASEIFGVDEDELRLMVAPGLYGIPRVFLRMKIAAIVGAP